MKHTCVIIKQLTLVPGTPGVPSIPSVPSRPGLPGIPLWPDLPGSPRLPSMPGLPGRPRDPGPPGMPLRPGIPLVPFRPAALREERKKQFVHYVLVLHVTHSTILHPYHSASSVSVSILWSTEALQLTFSWDSSHTSLSLHSNFPGQPS